MTSELVLAAIAAGTLVLFAARIYDRYRAHRTQRLRALGDEFYSAAGRLLANSEVSLEVVNLLDFMALSVAEPTLIWAWLKMLSSRRQRPASKVSPVPHMSESVTDEFIAATIAGLLFIAELHPIPGYLIRRHVQHLKRRKRSDPEKVKKAAKAIERWAHIEVSSKAQRRLRTPAPLAR